MVSRIWINGGTPEGLDLSGRNLQKIDLSFRRDNDDNAQPSDLRGTDLKGADLKGADLSNANLQGADMNAANLQGALLSGANLRGADLRFANLDGADFQGSDSQWTNMEVVCLHGARITETTRFRRVEWGKKKILGDELAEDWENSEEIYRDLKQWHQRTGDSDNAGGFHYREMECKRKLAKKKWVCKKSLQNYQHLNVLSLYRRLSGYGERPWRVVIVAFIVIFFFAPLYVPWNGLDLSRAGASNYFGHLWEALYFSGVSFTALGYGEWVAPPTGLTKYLGVVQSLIGVSLLALFLVTFTRNMSR